MPKRYKRLATMTTIKEGYPKIAERGYDATKAAVANGSLRPMTAAFALATGLLPANNQVLV